MMLAPDMLNLEEFSQPVESIMRCEDFKSNFARKLSNRYISRTPVASKQDTALKLPRNTTKLSDILSKSVSEQNGEAVKPPDKTNSDSMRSTEVTALNMEVETLRWQLSQTEANRQMHISLLKQVVSFLSRVKEHIECQMPELGSRKGSLSTRLTPRSFNVADLPRSRSVVQVNKHLELSLSPAKKMSTRKISKSPSELLSTPEEESTQKISEEITRLITLANTVLSTNIPDLACTYNDTPEYILMSEIATQDKSLNNDSISSITLSNDDNDTNTFILTTICNSEDTLNGITNDVKKGDVNDFMLSPSPLVISGLGNDFTEMKIIDKNPVKTTDASTKTQRFVEKRNEYNHAANFIEDESGFSSMSSFQEIGIPVISIVPPSPCKEVCYMDDITYILEETKGKSAPVDLDKQTVKVFWV
ncbi:Uncharacterized protein OBRU01_03734 [Operophtera brumata]|uniref:Uncharacterized protein n=1 Tax=Operophtera brumata TaxID=104452 RepID=A0A0L7LNC8_OPEBR|nr:Uncharacterized protein OBRU01_03734 [Operophtera brumata]